MYELFILGQLMDHPMTGYALRKAFTSIVGDDLAISFGTLYPLLDRLEQAGVITSSFKDKDNKRPQKLVSITEVGKRRFKYLAMEPTVINRQAQLTFLIKVHFLHLLNQKQQMQVLQDFLNFSNSRLQQLMELKTDLTANPRMLQADIDDALLVKQLQVLLIQTQITWITKLLEQRGR